MSRNNSDRMSGPPPGNKSPASTRAATVDNSSLNFSVPTEFVDLPSEGRLYPDDHPLYGEPHIEIRHMTAKEEDILSSQTLLKKGVALDRLLTNLIVNKQISPDSLYVGDKNAILVAARISGYGAEYKTRMICPSCFTNQEVDFDLNEKQIYKGDNYNDFDISKTGSGTFIIKLPVTTIDIEVRLLTGKQESHLAKLAIKKKKQKLPESTTTDQFKAIIVSANGNKEHSNIAALINHMPAKDARYLRRAYECISPKLDLRQAFECEACGFETEGLEVPFTTDFFWPKQ